MPDGGHRHRRKHFNPRSPRGERPSGSQGRGYSASGISIHAPRGGSDGEIRITAYRHQDFNPRSPRGERRSAQQAMQFSANISIHAPRGGSDPGYPVGLVVPDVISIHAPRGGSDSKSACFLCENLSIYHKFCTQIFLKAFSPLLST